MKKYNKKGDARVLSFYWIAIFILIGVAIVSSTVIFFRGPIDVRQVEAKILSDKIIDCISDQGELNNVFDSLKKDGSNLEQMCFLNFNDSNYKINQFYVEIGVASNKVIFNKDGSSRFISLCDEETRNYPQCYKEKIIVMDNNVPVEINILTIVNKIDQGI